MDNTIFGENTLYVQRIFSTTNPQQYSNCQKNEIEGVDTRNFGILADRVKDAIREQMALDAMSVNHMKIKAAGEKNPKAFMKSIKRGTRRRALIYQDAHPKKSDVQDNYKLADMMTHSPTNPRNYTTWARDLALRQMKKGAHSPIESQREKFTPIYEDLKNHKGTPNTRKVMEEAIDRIKDIEKERQTQSRHYIHLRPTIFQGRNNPYKYTD